MELHVLQSIKLTQYSKLVLFIDPLMVEMGSHVLGNLMKVSNMIHVVIVKWWGDSVLNVVSGVL